MRIDKEKLDLILARRCMCISELRNKFSTVTLTRINSGENVQVKTVGRLANALDCDPQELIADRSV